MRPREALMFKPGPPGTTPKEWLVVREDLVEEESTQGWVVLLRDLRSADVAEARQADEQRWSPQVRRRARWRVKKRHRPPMGSTGE